MMSRQSANVAAYELWMRGSYFVKLFLVSNREQDIQSAIRLYESAIALDSGYALAYGGLSWAYEHKFVMGGHANQSDREQVVRWLLKAYRLDSLSGGVNAGMGYLASVNRDYDRAHAFFTRALALEPRSYLVNYLLAEHLSRIGLNEQAELFFERSIAGDPFYLLALGEAADALEHRGEFDRAAAYYQRALRLSPEDPLYRASYVEFLVKTSRVKEAADVLQEALKRHPGFPAFARCRALVHAARGERQQALHYGKIPEVYALLGMRTEALRALEEKAGTRSNYEFRAVATNPLFIPLRNDPRFQAILGRLEAAYNERMEKYGELGRGET
jgi:tetratricopeptide (TPR) repeat protein